MSVAGTAYIHVHVCTYIRYIVHFCAFHYLAGTDVKLADAVESEIREEFDEALLGRLISEEAQLIWEEEELIAISQFTATFLHSTKYYCADNNPTFVKIIVVNYVRIRNYLRVRNYVRVCKPPSIIKSTMI